jgi:hypothetical protein
MHYLVRPAVVLAFAVLGAFSQSATAWAPAAHTTSGCAKTYTFAMFDRASDAVYTGTGLPPRGSYAALWRMARCQRYSTAHVATGLTSAAHAEYLARREWAADKKAWTMRRHPPTPVWESGGLADVPGVPYGFAACVALRESTDGAGSPDIYGILPSNGYYAGMSIVAQKLLFSAMYERDGASPWAPYDGC